MADAAAYGEELLILIEAAIDGNMSRREFEQRLRQTVNTSLEATFRRGANIPEGDILFGSEQDALNRVIRDHEASIIRMTNELYDAIELQRAEG